MTRTTLALALSILNPQTDAPVGRPRVELFWSDYKLLRNKLPAGARKAVEKEAQSIFGKAGIELSFFVGSPEDHGKNDADAIRIVLMPRSAEGWTLPGESMGAILERNGQKGTVYVFVPVVERVIGHPIDRKMLHDGSKAHALARALARVLAHETVHAIDPDIPHGPEGSVMSQNLTAPLLLGHHLSFDGTTKTRLLETLLKRTTARIPHL